MELRPADLLGALRLMQLGESDADGHHKLPPSLRVRRQAVNLKQRVADVLRRVRAHGGPLPFQSLVNRTGTRADRPELVLAFMAVLELVRLSQVTAWQVGPLGEIFLTARSPAAETA